VGTHAWHLQARGTPVTLLRKNNVNFWTTGAVHGQFCVDLSLRGRSDRPVQFTALLRIAWREERMWPRRYTGCRCLTGTTHSSWVLGLAHLRFSLLFLFFFSLFVCFSASFFVSFLFLFNFLFCLNSKKSDSEIV
jgi:hypothetical protein